MTQYEIVDHFWRPVNKGTLRNDSLFFLPAFSDPPQVIFSGRRFQGEVTRSQPASQPSCNLLAAQVDRARGGIAVR